MTKGATVQSSGASLSTPAAGAGGGGSAGSARLQMVRAASSKCLTARTIIETATCPPELKRGDQPWQVVGWGAPDACACTAPSRCAQAAPHAPLHTHPTQTPAFPPLSSPAACRNFSDFKVQKMLGEGTMSSVVHCVCGRSGVHAAIKMYHRDRMNSMNVKQVGSTVSQPASQPATAAAGACRGERSQQGPAPAATPIPFTAVT
jgi:hypothetical protein